MSALNHRHNSPHDGESLISILQTLARFGGFGSLGKISLRCANRDQIMAGYDFLYPAYSA